MHAAKTCLRCGNTYTPTARCQKYCGKQKVKGSCSYLENLVAMDEYRKDPENRKIRKTYMQSYWSEFKKTPGYKEYLESRKRIYLRSRFLILKRDNFTCQYCGRRAPDVELQIDHIHPRAKGGKSKLDNLITSCKECNLGKSDVLLRGE